jgi:hypothetical protein
MTQIRMNYAEFEKEWTHSTAAIDKAASSAVKTVAYKTMMDLRRDIRQGRAGGNTFAPLREISKSPSFRQQYWNVGGGKFTRIPKNKPLWTLAKVTRYRVKENRDTLFAYEVGFVGPSISGNWKEIATRQQTGNTYNVSTSLRKKLYSVGAALKKKKDPSYRYFFVQAKSMTLPSRDIIDSFRAANQGNIVALIRERFEQKLRGQWISQGRRKSA